MYWFGWETSFISISKPYYSSLRKIERFESFSEKEGRLIDVVLTVLPFVRYYIQLLDYLLQFLDSNCTDNSNGCLILCMWPCKETIIVPNVVYILSFYTIVVLHVYLKPFTFCLPYTKFASVAV